LRERRRNINEIKGDEEKLEKNNTMERRRRKRRKECRQIKREKINIVDQFIKINK
jgi:hypothetical protein